jgi:hypothetical protein
MWFVAPGPLGAEGGLAVLDDDDDDVTLTLFDATGTARLRQVLVLPSGPDVSAEADVSDASEVSTRVVEAV